MGRCFRRRCFLRNLNNDSLSRFVLKKIRHLIVYEMFERRNAASECRSINRECVSDKVEQTLTSSIPRLQRVILALPLRSHRSTIRTYSLKSNPHLSDLAFSTFAKRAPSRLGMPRQFLYSRYSYPVRAMPDFSAGIESKKVTRRFGFAGRNSPRSQE